MHIIDEYIFEDWVVLDAEIFTGALCEEFLFTLEPVDELRLNFVTEYNFLDWVNIEECFETVAYRATNEITHNSEASCSAIAQFEHAAEVIPCSVSVSEKVTYSRPVKLLPIETLRRAGYVDIEQFVPPNKQRPKAFKRMILSAVLLLTIFRFLARSLARM